MVGTRERGHQYGASLSNLLDKNASCRMRLSLYTISVSFKDAQDNTMCSTCKTHGITCFYMFYMEKYLSSKNKNTQDEESY